MKGKILTFIIGVLVGAIIATGGYYFYSKSNTKDFNGMPDGERPTMMQDGNSTDGNMGTPPEKPSDDDGNGPKGAPGQNNNSSNTENNNTNTDNSESNV